MLNIVPDKWSCISITSKDIIGNATAEAPHRRAYEAKVKLDQELLNERVQHSKRYSLLRPDVVPLFLVTNQLDYNYVTNAAIRRLDEKINMKLDILHHIYEGEDSRNEPSETLSNRVFNWSMQDFLSRRKLNDFVWIDVMLRLTDTSLRTFKFKKDIEQLKAYLRYIFNGLYERMVSEEFKVKEKVIDPICNAKKVFHITRNLKKECEGHKELYWQIMQKDTFIANVKRESLDMAMRLFMESKKNNCYSWNPIELRYQMGWYTAKVGQTKCRIDSLLHARQSSIENTVKKNYIETNVSASCLDFYYTYIDGIKTQINSLQNKLDTDYEAYEARLNLKRSNIDKLRDKWKFHKEEIERFHEELDIIRRLQDLEVYRKMEEEEANNKRRTMSLRNSKLAKDIKAKVPAAKNAPPIKTKAAIKPKK